MKNLLTMLTTCCMLIQVINAPAEVDEGGTFNVMEQTANRGDEITVNFDVSEVLNLAGWEMNIVFNPQTLSVVSITEGDFLKRTGNTLFLKGTTDNNAGTITGLTGVIIDRHTGTGEGTLFSIRFQTIREGEGEIEIHNFKFITLEGNYTYFKRQIGSITITRQFAWDINGDGIVDISDILYVAQNLNTNEPKADANFDGRVDIVDLVLVVNHHGETSVTRASATRLTPDATYAMIHEWINLITENDDGSINFRKAIDILESILMSISLIPETTKLLPNYPNPFNPDTWIPYHLSEDAEVYISIYDSSGKRVKRINIGYQTAGYYTDRERAVHWNGYNAHNEKVVSGVYYCLMTAGKHTSGRKMVILK